MMNDDNWNTEKITADLLPRIMIKKTNINTSDISADLSKFRFDHSFYISCISTVVYLGKNLVNATIWVRLMITLNIRMKRRSGLPWFFHLVCIWLLTFLFVYLPASMCRHEEKKKTLLISYLCGEIFGNRSKLLLLLLLLLLLVPKK